MKFQKINEMIPYVKGGKQKILSMTPYNGVTLRLPGRHAEQTNPVGGDFVVCVDDENMGWVSHQFTHNDLFVDLKHKSDEAPNATTALMKIYLRVINGESPEKLDEDDEYTIDFLSDFGIHPQTFLYSVQCLAVAEHRRYAQHEPKFGGRYLPFRYSTGIVQGLWDASAAISMQKRGRPGVEILEKVNGTPDLTKELMLNGT